MEEVHTQEHRALFGMCSKRVKGPPKSGMLIPDEFLQPYKTQFMDEATAQMMKILRQVLPSEMLARIAPSITDPSDNLVNGQSSSDINKIDQSQVITNTYNCLWFPYILSMFLDITQLTTLLLFLERWR